MSRLNYRKQLIDLVEANRALVRSLFNELHDQAQLDIDFIKATMALLDAVLQNLEITEKIIGMLNGESG